jgi:hypothetical protein
MLKMKALPITVYSNKKYAGCSNGGISEKFDDLLLIHEEGFIDIDESNPPENLVKVVTRNIFGNEYKHIEPYKKATGIGYMAGGSYAASSDSRFSRVSQYPLAIHDRQETQEQYDMLSR